MSLRFNISIYLVSIISFILLIYFLINYLNKQPFEKINFIDSDIHEDFEAEITNNLDNINDYLKEYLFIDSHLLKRDKNEINIQITLKQYFAVNKLTKEVIFYNNTKAPISYFKQNYLDSIDLIDISDDSIYINKYLYENFTTLSSLFKIEQIKYIDDRRYNLVLSDGKVVMLPKVIDSKLMYFINNNIDLIDQSTNYKKFLDLRNFHNKTIRLK